MIATILGMCFLIAAAASPGAAQVSPPTTGNTKVEEELLNLSR